MSRRQPCRFYNTPSGCRRSDCRFEHVLTGGQAAPSSPSTPAGASGVTTQSPPAGSTSSMPNGTCSFFWKTGHCNREFRCRYKHDLSPELRAQSQSQSNASASSTSRGTSTLAPFLTQAGLARLSGAGSDALFTSAPKPRTPSEAHNALKRFLYDDYTFRHGPDVYAFLGLLNSASSNNNSWVSIDFLTLSMCTDVFFSDY